MRLKKSLLLTALLVVAATAYFNTSFSDPQTRQSLAAPAERSADNALTAAKNAAVRDLVNPAFAQSVQATPAPRAATESLRAVLPQVTEIPADWREFQPDQITFEPYPGMAFTFTRTRVKQNDKRSTWIGRNPNLPGASLIAVGTKNRYDAVMIIPGMSQFSVHVDPDGGSFVKEANPGDEFCGLGPIPEHIAASQKSNIAAIYERITPANAMATGTPAIEAATTVTAAIQVDVLFVYDAKTLALFKTISSDAIGLLDEYSSLMTEVGNLILEDSLVTNFQWRYVGLEASPAFAQNDTLSTDLDAMAPGGVIHEWVRSLRYNRGADQILFWHGSEGTSTDAAGQGFARNQMPVSYDYALAAVRIDSSYKSVLHELAHNFGCQHDRANVNSDNATNPSVPDSNGLYCYGQLWTNPNPIPDYPYPNTASTLMGYGSATIPYFSNPEITLQITAVLADWPAGVSDWGTQALGVAVGQPKAAYNAKVLQDNALALSKMTEEIAVPQIIQQPASGTAFNGQTLSVSAQISGGGLTYQWSKDGSPITGATSATYLKSPASNSDAGTYSVKATNRLGSVTSNDAVITITTPPPPPSGGGGGGGGGGSISLWFLAALSTLATARYFSRR